MGDTEMWDHRGFNCWNPATPRFSPFQFPPRDCIGKNFAQMEMRAILSHLFRNFDFTLGQDLAQFDQAEITKGELGCNRGTMGPKNMVDVGHSARFNIPVVKVGMNLVATPRKR